MSTPWPKHLVFLQFEDKLQLCLFLQFLYSPKVYLSHRTQKGLEPKTRRTTCTLMSWDCLTVTPLERSFTLYASMHFWKRFSSNCNFSLTFVQFKDKVGNVTTTGQRRQYLASQQMFCPSSFDRALLNFCCCSDLFQLKWKITDMCNCSFAYGKFFRRNLRLTSQRRRRGYINLITEVLRDQILKWNVFWS